MNYNFYLKNNRAVTPRNFIIDNKYSNEVSSLNFNFDDVEDLEDYTYKYIALKINSSSYILPIVNNKITITSNISKLPGLYTAVLILRNRPYEETTEEFKQFVSNEFYFEIKNNFLTETIGTEPTEENIAAWYEEIEEYVHSDEFKEACKGEDGAPGPAGADGAPGTTFIPSVSQEGVISWINDGDLPNPESRNIKGPKGDDGNDIYNSYVSNSYWCGKLDQPEAIETRPFYFDDTCVYDLVNVIPEGNFYQIAYGDRTKWLYYKWTDGADTTACIFKYWLDDEIDSSNFWSKQLLRVELWKNGQYKLNYHTDYTNMNDDTYIVHNGAVRQNQLFLKHYILSPEDFASEYLREETFSNSLRKGGNEGQEVGTK
jgi:hypothetical protein